MMDMAAVIANFATGPYVVTRSSGAAYDANGRLVGPATSTVSIDGCLQPLSGRMRRLLPEGIRTEDTRELWTTARLYTDQEGQAADALQIDGEAFVVIRVEPWDALGNYWTAALQKVGN